MNKTVRIALVSAILAFVAGFGSGYVARPSITGSDAAVPSQPASPPLIDPTTIELEPIRPSVVPDGQNDAAAEVDPVGDSAVVPEPSSQPSRPPGVPAEGDPGQGSDNPAAPDPAS